MISKLFPWLVLVCLAGRARAQAACSASPAARHPGGVLSGLDSEDAGDASDSLPSDSAALIARGLAGFREDTARGFRVRSVTSTERADPLSTLWILACDGGMTTRLVQHIVIPRKDGFWRLGMNAGSAELFADSSTDSTDWRHDTAEMNFFWVARLNESPRLRSLGPDDVPCSTTSDMASLTYVGSNFVGSTTFSQSSCAHYYESHAMGVASLDSLRVATTSAAATGAQTVALLGPDVAARHRRLNESARDWESDCGERGFESDATDWTIRRERGSWVAVANFYGTGGGICGRYNDERRLRTGLPASFGAPAARLPVAWRAIEKVVPGAVDATASPDQRMLIVLAPSGTVDLLGRQRLAVTLLRVDHGSLRSVGQSLGVGGPWVMLEWAAGERAMQWDRVMSTLPVLPSDR